MPSVEVTARKAQTKSYDRLSLITPTLLTPTGTAKACQIAVAEAVPERQRQPDDFDGDADRQTRVAKRMALTKPVRQAPARGLEFSGGRRWPWSFHGCLPPAPHAQQRKPPLAPFGERDTTKNLTIFFFVFSEPQ
jgi:hypothetical protein